MTPIPFGATPVHTGRVLVADDDAQNRLLLRELLAAQGHQVREATDGEQALQMVTLSSTDVVVLDVMMPRLDGFEVCRRLKANPGTAPIPILLLTALAERQDRLTGI